jgi:hypothetical protein
MLERMMSLRHISVVIYLIMTIRDELLDDNLLFRFCGPCSVVVAKCSWNHVLFPRSTSRLFMRMVLTSSFCKSLCFWKVEKVVEGHIHRVIWCKIVLGDKGALWRWLWSWLSWWNMWPRGRVLTVGQGERTEPLVWQTWSEFYVGRGLDPFKTEEKWSLCPLC